MSKEEKNTELDYILCDMLNICMDELDSIDLNIVEKMRKSVICKLNT